MDREMYMMDRDMYVLTGKFTYGKGNGHMDRKMYLWTW